jgi:acyl-coenzyme A synthetase/AMP-(fatty) acid ligase
VRDNGGHAVALAWSMRNIYGTLPGETFWAASDIGWVVGHSYIVYGPLLNGNTTVLYEGKPVGTPDPGAFWRVAEQHRVRTLFTAPTALRAIKREDPAGEHVRRYDLSRCARCSSRANARTRPTLRWARAQCTFRCRPLVADRDRLGDHGELPRRRAACRSRRRGRATRPRLRRASARRGRPRCRPVRWARLR